MAKLREMRLASEAQAGVKRKGAADGTKSKR